MSPLAKIEGALECPTKSTPPFVSSSTAPHLSEEGQGKNAGAQPRIVLCVRPRRGWVPARMKWWEVMIYWGSGTAPASQTLFLVGSYIIDCSPLIGLWKKRSLESNSIFYLIGLSLIAKPTEFHFFQKGQPFWTRPIHFVSFLLLRNRAKTPIWIQKWKIFLSVVQSPPHPADHENLTGFFFKINRSFHSMVSQTKNSWVTFSIVSLLSLVERADTF